MTPKQFLKRALVGSALGMIVVVAASLSYAYVVPSLLDADSIPLFPNSTLNIHSQDKSQTNYDSSPVPVQHQSSNCKSSP